MSSTVQNVFDVLWETTMTLEVTRSRADIQLEFMSLTNEFETKFKEEHGLRFLEAREQDGKRLIKPQSEASFQRIILWRQMFRPVRSLTRIM